jgi:hypothetical protein
MTQTASTANTLLSSQRFITASPTSFGHSYCFGATGIVPALSQNVVNTFVTQTTIVTSTCASLSSVCVATSTTTLTNVLNFNSPNMPSLNFWLLPVLIILVPYGIVLAVFVRATGALDLDVLMPVSLTTVMLTSWLGYAWSAFVPIYIPVAFTIVLAIVIWRR